MSQTLPRNAELATPVLVGNFHTRTYDDVIAQGGLGERAPYPLGLTPTARRLSTIGACELRYHVVGKS
jgi:hypothetical protein